MLYIGVRFAGGSHAHHDHSHGHAVQHGHGNDVHSHGHGHGHDHHEHHEVLESKSNRAKYQIPTASELKEELPSKLHFNEKFSQWLSARWQVDRDDILSNDYPNKFAAYYWF